MHGYRCVFSAERLLFPEKYRALRLFRAEKKHIDAGPGS